MEPVAAWLKHGLLAVALSLLAVVGLLLFAVIAVVLRPLLILAGVGAVLLCCFSPRFRHWLDAASQHSPA